jgi:IS30 family transposase
MDLWFNNHWSPEQIANRLRLEGGPFQVSHATIYRGIYAHLLEEHRLGKDERGVVLRLRHKGRRRGRRGPDSLWGRLNIPNHSSSRPQEAMERSRIGHWEADTVAGKLNTGRIVPIVDRKTRFALAGKVDRKEAGLVADEMIRLLSALPAEKVLSITPDLGKEFFAHQKVSRALNQVPFFFPDPGAPWQRPTNENFNGLLREFFPKRTSFAGVSLHDIHAALALLNSRPRKVLSWRSPLEAFFDILLHLT